MYGTTTLHPTASIFTIIDPRPAQGTTCTVNAYVGEDVWMEEGAVTIPYTHAEQDPLFSMCLAFMPWWPTDSHSLPAIEERKAA